VDTFLPARRHNAVGRTRTDYAVVFQVLIDLRVLRINVRGFRSGRSLKCCKVFACEDLTGVCIHGDHIQAEWIGRKLGDLPGETIAIRGWVDGESRRNTLYSGQLLREDR